VERVNFIKVIVEVDTDKRTIYAARHPDRIDEMRTAFEEIMEEITKETQSGTVDTPSN